MGYQSYLTDKEVDQYLKKRGELEVGDRVQFVDEQKRIDKVGEVSTFDTENLFKVKVRFTDGRIESVDVRKLQKIKV